MKKMQCFMIILLYILNGNAQITIQGTVKDVSNTPVNNALVEVIDEKGSGQTFSDYTQSNGSFSINASLTGISDDNGQQPNSFLLLGNYPNPFNPSTIIRFDLRSASQAEIKIYNVLGKVIKSWSSRYYPSGENRVKWDGTDDQGMAVAAGVYFCVLKTGDRLTSHKMLLMDGGGSDVPSYQPAPEKLNKTNSAYRYTLRVSGESISTLEINHLSCLNDTSLQIQVGHTKGQTIGTNGGEIVLESGFRLNFQEGTFDEDVTVTVSEVPATAQPDQFLTDVQAISPFIAINCGGVTPNFPVKVAFQLSPDALAYGDSTLAIFRHGGSEWSYMGGIVRNDTIATYTRNFSLFVTGYERTHSKVYRRIRFEVQGLYNAIVYVSKYKLLYPEWDVPIPPEYGLVCFTLPHEPQPEGNIGFYPQGWYQFCAEWWDDAYHQWRHRYMGGDPPHWSYFLYSMTSLDVPPMAYINVNIAGALDGPCPCEVEQKSFISTGLEGVWTNSEAELSLDIRLEHWIIMWGWLGLEEVWFPVVHINTAEQYVILWDPDDAESENKPYIKIEWSVIDQNTIEVRIYDTHETIQEAIDDQEIEVTLELIRSA